MNTLFHIHTPRTRGSAGPEPRGFTLIEALVAITIVVFAVTGTLSVVATNVTTAHNAEDRVTAFYLAQDALEYVRNLRDTSSIRRNKGLCPPRSSPCDLATVSWLAALSECTDFFGDATDKKCAIDTTKGFENAIHSPEGDFLYLDENENTFTYDTLGNSQTAFKRIVEVDEISASREALVTVTMTWQKRLIPHSITITEHMFNWQAGVE